MPALPSDDQRHGSATGGHLVRPFRDAECWGDPAIRGPAAPAPGYIHRALPGSEACEERRAAPGFGTRSEVVLKTVIDWRDSGAICFGTRRVPWCYPWADGLVVTHKSGYSPHSSPEQKNAEQGMSNFEGSEASGCQEESQKATSNRARRQPVFADLPVHGRRPSSLLFVHFRDFSWPPSGMVLQHSKFLVQYSAVRVPDTAP